MEHSRKNISLVEGTFDRRRLLGAGAAGAALSQLPWFAATALGHGSRLFSLGVSSGDPSSDSVVIWTRLAPRPLEGGGMDRRQVPVRWEVALDPRMRRVVRRGVAHARAEWAHAVHVTVEGLDPDRWYFYRFQAGHEDSPVGRTRTLPAPHALPRRLRFGLVSCQDYQNGFFSAYQNLAAEELDFVVHVGDYIYEDGPRPLAPRQVPAGEIITLDDYRNRYALYQLDPALQAAHAAFPFVVTFDDHEVENNYAGNIPEENQDPVAFARRRQGAYHAYYEHMALGERAQPDGNAIALYRKLRFGRLAQLHVLDTRQFRTDQPCGDGLKPPCAGFPDPAGTMTGAAQEEWLRRSLARSEAIWNPIAQQVMFMRWNLGPAAAPGTGIPFFNMDAWDGYPVARQRLLDFLVERHPANPIFLTGDIHSAWAADILEDFAQPDAGIVAAEFVATSISSDFPAALIPAVQATLPANPHIRYFEAAHRGYLRFDVTRDRWRADYRGVATIASPQSPVSTLASFVVEAGHAGVIPA